MENATLENVVQRLDRLEKMVVEMNQQFSRLPGELIQEPPGNCKTGDEVMAHYGQSKERNAEIIQSMFAKMGISGEPIPAEELQARMARQGIRPEDNEFSRAIIAEREK